MAKNKNRKQERQRSSQATQAREHAEQSSMESQPAMSQPQGSPADVARRQQKRFGHN
jgi:hypothetical protein